MQLLVNEKLAEKGMKVVTSTGKTGTLEHWQEPHKPSSSGKVYVRMDDGEYISQFYPSVIGGKFVR